MRITLARGDYGTYLLLAEDGRDILIQSDWDFPDVASTFGWSPCECGETDGTIDCDHKTASQMIADAAEFLDDNEGAETDDPGYFEDLEDGR